MSRVSKPNPAETSRKKTPRLQKLALAVMFCVSAWGCVTVFGQMSEFHKKEKEMQTLQAQLDETRRINEESKLEVNRLNSPEYTEEKARKELQMAKQGEIIFDISKNTP